MSNSNDPINALINYANEIKPYHSKVIEILTAYIYNEDVQVNISEQLITNFGIVVSRVNVDNTFADIFNGTYGQGPYDSFTAWPVISINESLVDGAFDENSPGYNIANNSVIIPDDQTSVYRSGREVELDVFKIDTSTNERSNTQSPILSFTISSSVVATPGQINGIINNPHTILTLDEQIPNLETLLGSLASNEVYAATVRIMPVPINNVILNYGNTEQIIYTDVPPSGAPTPTPTSITSNSNPNEDFAAGNYFNSVLLDGDLTGIYPFGTSIVILLNNGQTREFTTAHTFYDSVNDLSVIRLTETLDANDDFTNAQFVEKFYGLDEIFQQSNIADTIEGLVQTVITEKLVFNWGESGTQDVINGSQFLIRSINSNIISINGDAISTFEVGDVINIIQTTNNDGNHAITAITSTGLGTDIAVSSNLSDATSGGWLEST